MPDSVYPDLSNDKFDIKYARLKVLPSDIVQRRNQTSGGIPSSNPDTVDTPAGTSSQVITLQSETADYSATDFDTTISTFTAFLKCDTDNTILQLPDPKIFPNSTINNNNTIFFLRRLTEADDFSAVVIVESGSSGTIEGTLFFAPIFGSTYAIQSNGEEYKIIAKYEILPAGAVTTDNETIQGDGTIGNLLIAILSQTYRFVASVVGNNALGLTLNKGVNTIFAESTIGDVEILLPAANIFSPLAGNVPIVAIVGEGGTNPKKITVIGSGTINGSAPPIFFNNDETYWLQSNGVEWRIINHVVL